MHTRKRIGCLVNLAGAQIYKVHLVGDTVEIGIPYEVTHRVSITVPREDLLTDTDRQTIESAARKRLEILEGDRWMWCEGVFCEA